MFCKYCGKEVAEDASFCQNCGKQLLDKKADEQKQESNFKNSSSTDSVGSTNNDTIKNISESLKKFNSLCIAGVVIFTFGIMYFRNTLVMLAAFFVSFIGYSDAKKKNQRGSTIALICLILAGIMSISGIATIIRYR